MVLRNVSAYFKGDMVMIYAQNLTKPVYIWASYHIWCFHTSASSTTFELNTIRHIAHCFILYGIDSADVSLHKLLTKHTYGWSR